MIHKRKSTRHIPLVFVRGAQEKVIGVRELIPDAIFTSWEVIGPALRRAITSPPAEPIFHAQTFAGYAHKSLIEKLGIKTNMTVSLVNLPDDFDNTLGNFPENIKIHLEAIRSIDLTIWFCQSREEPVNQINDIAAQA